MSLKQKIYCEMLKHGLVHIRNIQTHGWLKKAGDRTSHHLAELLHNLPSSLLEEEFGEHDVWFLNHQARLFLERRRKDDVYDTMEDLIKQLFDIVPKNLKVKLQWKGPS